MYDGVWRGELADGKSYCIQQGFILKTARKVNHGDWKTVAAKNIPTIPADTEVVVDGWFSNFYGRWITVYYGGRTYDISPRDLLYVRGRDRWKRREF